MAVVDALGYPVRFTILLGQTHDRDICGWRHLVENLFAKIKAIATRYDRTDGSFAAGIHLVAGVVAAT